VPQVEVTFDIDANGILHVSAKDLGTGKEQKIQIVSPHKLDKREIDEMMKQAEKFAEQDKKKQEEAVARNDGDAMVYAAEKFLTDYADKLKQEDKEKIQSLAGELKQALSGSDSLAVKQKLDALKKEMQRVGSEFYKKGRGESAGGSGPGDSGGNDFAGGNFGFESPGSGGNQGNGAKDAEFREK
jgi:molecular chaperone DnaK